MENVCIMMKRINEVITYSVLTHSTISSTANLVNPSPKCRWWFELYARWSELLFNRYFFKKYVCIGPLQNLYARQTYCGKFSTVSRPPFSLIASMRMWTESLLIFKIVSDRAYRVNDSRTSSSGIYAFSSISMAERKYTGLSTSSKFSWSNF